MIEILSPSENSIIITSPTYRENSFEHSLCYDRQDGKRVEMTLTHLPNISGDDERAPMLHLVTRKIRKNPQNSLNEFIGLSMEETRLLKDFLNRPEVTAWLEEE